MEQNKELGTYEAVQEASNQEQFVQGFALSGDYVKNLIDKSFQVVGHRYETVRDLSDATKTKQKLILLVKISDGSIVDYMPNKTSQQVIIAQKGYRLDSWIGFKGKFYTLLQKVGQLDKNVIYIKEEVQ
jgi:hypothetical protein